MKELKELKYTYVVLIIFMLIACVAGSTYAYISSSTVSSDNSVGSGSTGYDVSLSVTPVYASFSLIPMDDSDALKAVDNECKDKYGHGACNLYNINVHGYSSSISSISGTINTTLNGITNLSYMVLEEVSYNITNEPDCVSIDNANYCISKTATSVIGSTDMSLGNNYNVFGLASKNLMLAFWITNLDENQNSFDIGNYDSVVTIFLGGDGGQVSGSISGTLENYNSLQGRS